MSEDDLNECLDKLSRLYSTMPFTVIVVNLVINQIKEQMLTDKTACVVDRLSYNFQMQKLQLPKESSFFLIFQPFIDLFKWLFYIK